MKTSATAVLRIEGEMTGSGGLVGEVAVGREVIDVLRQLEPSGKEGPTEEEHHEDGSDSTHGP